MSKYAALDAAILATLAEKSKHFTPLFSGAVSLQCNTAMETYDARRVLDRRLQALSKRGLLIHNRTYGWMLIAGKP